MSGQGLGDPQGRTTAGLPGGSQSHPFDPSWLTGFRAVLLDVNGTFMFDHDRFSPADDYGATYRALGGTGMPVEAVNRAIRQFVDAYGRLYRDPRHEDDFPSVRHVLHATNPAVPDTELRHLEAVIAVHEIGCVPPAHAAVLRRLALAYRLGVVSNLWSSSGPWRDAFAGAGIADLFDTMIFSSDHGCVKPAARLFRIALDALELPPADVVFVGDDLQRDVAGAQALGLATIWIGNARQLGPDTPRPDRIINALTDLIL